MARLSHRPRSSLTCRAGDAARLPKSPIRHFRQARGGTFPHLQGALVVDKLVVSTSGAGGREIVGYRKRRAGNSLRVWLRPLIPHLVKSPLQSTTGGVYLLFGCIGSQGGA